MYIIMMHPHLIRSINKYIMNNDIDFILHNGDIAYDLYENNDDLWEDLGSRVMNVDGYNELKDVVVNWMVNQMNTAYEA